MSKRYVGIDPSSTTGFFIQDEKGNIVIEQDIFYEYTVDPQRMIHISDTIINNLQKDDIICIESFSMNSQGRALTFQSGLGWIIREQLHRKGYSYYDVTPKSVKKFATGNGNATKTTMIKPIQYRWGFYHASDNIMDAFVMSEIAKAIDLGNDYEGLRQHEKEIVRKVKSSVLNNEELTETKLPSWMNPRSKYYFVRE